VGWILFLLVLSTGHAAAFALPTISRATGQLYHTHWVPVGTAPGLSHLLDSRNVGAAWWRTPLVLAALLIDFLFVGAVGGAWWMGRRLRERWRLMLVMLVFLQGTLLALGTLPAYLDDDPVGLRPPTSVARALVHRTSAWTTRQDVAIQVAGMLASAGTMGLLLRRLLPLLRMGRAARRAVPVAPLAVVLAAMVGFTPVARARAPLGPYEPFRVKTDSVPQAEIAGWVLPATKGGRGAGGRGNGTVFVLHGYNNDKERMVGWEWMRDRENWNVVMFDFREHGESTRSAHLCSLGYHEIWDVKAVVDHAERRGLPRPYVIYGRSMGAATGLRWASMDRRISGVLAVSPFRNAYTASRQAAAWKLHIPMLPSPFTLSSGFKEMLKEVDIPSALSKRNDLRIWIISGEFDCFPREDQEAILSASASLGAMKRLVIAPGCSHHDVWTYSGHDQYVRDFLSATLADRGPAIGSSWVVSMLGGAVAIGVAGVGVYWWKLRGGKEGRVEGELPPPLDEVGAS
jgi:hypothetical protein